MSFLYLLLSVFPSCVWQRGKGNSYVFSSSNGVVTRWKSKRTLPRGPWFLVRTQKKNLRSYLWKNKFIEEQKEHTSRKRWAKPRRALVPEWWVWGFQDKAFLHFHLGGHGLTVWLTFASYITACIAHVFAIIQSVYSDVCMCKMLWTLKGSQLPKVIWGHSFHEGCMCV